jgi:hypothetical protein
VPRFPMATGLIPRPLVDIPQNRVVAARTLARLEAPRDHEWSDHATPVLDAHGECAIVRPAYAARERCVGNRAGRSSPPASPGTARLAFADERRIAPTLAVASEHGDVPRPTRSLSHSTRLMHERRPHVAQLTWGYDSVNSRPASRCGAAATRVAAMQAVSSTTHGNRDSPAPVGNRLLPRRAPTTENALHHSAFRRMLKWSSHLAFESRCKPAL